MVVKAESVTEFYNFDISSISSGNVSNNGTNWYVLPLTKFQLSDNVITIPDGAYNIKASYQFVATSSPFLMNSLESGSFWNLKAVFVNGKNVNTNQNYLVNNYNRILLSSSALVDISNLFSIGENIIDFSMYFYHSGSIPSSSWTFSGSSFGTLNIYLSYDYTPNNPAPTPVPTPDPLPNPSNPSFPTPPSGSVGSSNSPIGVRWFTATTVPLREVFGGTSPTYFKTQSIGSFPVGSPTGSSQAIYIAYGVDSSNKGTWCYSNATNVYIPHEGVYTTNQDVINAINSQTSYFSSVFGILSSNLTTNFTTVIKGLNSLSLQLNSIENTANSIDDNIKNAHGSNSSLNQSNSEVNSTLQDYKDKTDTSDQYDKITDDLFEFDSSFFVQFAPTITLFSSLVTSIWHNLGDFSVPLAMFLIICLVSVIIGIVNHIRR